MQETNTHNQYPKASTTTKAQTPLNDAMQEQILDGLLTCLKETGGDITKVTSAALVQASGLQPATYDYYYGTPFNIIMGVRSTMCAYIHGVEDYLKTNYKISRKAAYEVLLRHLLKQPKMLKILVDTKDLFFFETNLRWMVRRFVNKWPKGDTYKEWWYKCFCYLFYEIIAKWASYDFSEDYIPLCATFIDKLLVMDSFFTDNMMMWLTNGKS